MKPSGKAKMHHTSRINGMPLITGNALKISTHKHVVVYFFDTLGKRDLPLRMRLPVALVEMSTATRALYGAQNPF
jgi:hypothetical protein